MLIGEYNHSVDTKGRINFPAKFREELGTEFYVTCWMEDCLIVLDKQSMERISERLALQSTVKSRKMRRYFFPNATLAEPDKQGRILLPANLRTYAGIEKDAVVIGAGNYAEIWTPERWNDEINEIRTGPLEELMEELDF